MKIIYSQGQYRIIEVNDEFFTGVFGYILQKWNQEWENIDNCFGFVGPYTADNQHYIVDEYINQIEVQNEKA